MQANRGLEQKINNNSASQSVPAGQTDSYNLDVMPLGNGSVFPSNVNLSCASVGLPPLSTCTFTPTQVASGQGDTNTVLKVVTTGAVPASASLTGTSRLLWYDRGLSLTGVLAFGGMKKSRRRKSVGVRLAIFSMLVGLSVACGGGSSGGSGGSGAGHPGATPGSYTITVTGAVDSVTRTVEVGLTVQ
jgi:hypothetical protein